MDLLYDEVTRKLLPLNLGFIELFVLNLWAVSYTHLTLPTILRV